jgi:hypothetical protein
MSFCGVSELGRSFLTPVLVDRRASRRLLQRSFLTRLLRTTGLSLALMTASAAGVYAESVTVQGKDGTIGIGPNFVAGDGESVTASAGSAQPITSPLNTATASGGNGAGAPFGFLSPVAGSGGAATATATTTIIFGSAGANAAATGGTGGDSMVESLPDLGQFSDGGSGGAATASATGSTGSGNATVSASAVGGNAGSGFESGGNGGGANASSTARANGSGDAVSSATATGGEGRQGGNHNGIGGSATAMADASAAGGGKAIATAVATSIAGDSFTLPGNANATSNAETVKGAMAQALSTAVQGAFTPLAPGGQATSTAKTSLAGVSVQSKTAVALGDPSVGNSLTATTDAIAQGRSGQTFVDPGETAAISTALPDKAYATTLIDGASSVADALLGPRDEIFGTAILATAGEPGVLFSSASATFDFSFRGDLILGVIADGGFDITANGIDIPFEDGGDNSVINLGFLGPNIDLTIEGDGVFAFGGAVPEPSTWALMLLGFAGLGFVGYRTNNRVNVRVV